MGLIPGTDYEPADDACDQCFGTTFGFGNIITPKYLCVTLSGITPCPGFADPNGVACCSQQFPCIWEGHTDNAYVYYNATGGGRSTIWAQQLFWPYAPYFGQNGIICQKSFDNFYVAGECWRGYAGTGGNAGINWGPACHP